MLATKTHQQAHEPTADLRELRLNELTLAQVDEALQNSGYLDNALTSVRFAHMQHHYWRYETTYLCNHDGEPKSCHVVVWLETDAESPRFGQIVADFLQSI